MNIRNKNKKTKNQRLNKANDQRENRLLVKLNDTSATKRVIKPEHLERLRTETPKQREVRHGRHHLLVTREHATIREARKERRWCNTPRTNKKEVEYLGFKPLRNVFATSNITA